MGEHLLCKQGVIGSNPFTSTRVKASKVLGPEAPNPHQLRFQGSALAGFGAAPHACLPSSYRSEEMVFGSAGAVTLVGGDECCPVCGASPVGGVVVFVSVNQVLVRPWACRLRDGLPCRAVGRLAAMLRVSVGVVIAKSDRLGSVLGRVRSSDRRHKRSGVPRWFVFCDGGWAAASVKCFARAWPAWRVCIRRLWVWMVPVHGGVWTFWRSQGNAGTSRFV